MILKFIWKSKSSRIANIILKEKNKVGGLTLLDLKTYCKAAVIKTVWYWQKKSQTDQRKRIESPEIDPHKFGQLTFDKTAKVIQWRKTRLFKNWCCNNWTTTCKNMNLDINFIPFMKINLK